MEQKSVSGSAATSGQQFNLRWNNHTNNILQVFIEQFSNENLVDVTLSCQGMVIKAHKMILSACSQYFQDLFKMHTAPHPVIIMCGMKFSDIKQVVDFMYKGEVRVLESELNSLLAAAEILQVKGLCSVRNKNETGDDEPVSSEVSKKLKMSDDEAKPTKGAVVQSENKDDDLSSSIQIDPPDIKDIDGEVSAEPKTNDADEPKLKTQPRILKKKATKRKAELVQSYPEKIEWHLQDISEDRNKLMNKIPRPPNAFMIFANEWRRKLAAEHPKESNKEISVRLGIMWKNLSSDTKENYYSQSRKADEEHRLKYPGYYYSPKEARLRKTMKNYELFRKTTKSFEAMRLVKLVMPEESGAASETRQDAVIEHEEQDDDAKIDCDFSNGEIEVDENKLVVVKSEQP